MKRHKVISAVVTILLIAALIAASVLEIQSLRSTKTFLSADEAKNYEISERVNEADTYCVSHSFMVFYDRHRDPRYNVFGSPISAEFDMTIDGTLRTVQYFHKARFEYHPEIKLGQPGEVTLGSLGKDLSELEYNPLPKEFDKNKSHSVDGDFMGMWSTKGRSEIFGNPISEPFYEVDPMDGTLHRVQYFERAVFQTNPAEIGTTTYITLRNIGDEIYKLQQARRTLPPNATEPCKRPA